MATTSFNISQNGPHGTVISYSNNAIIRVSLIDGSNGNSFKESLLSIPYQGRDTRLDRALYLARIALFDKKNGARSKVPKILVLFTDGQHNGLSSKHIDMAQELQDLGVHVVAIGIGGGVNKEHLKDIATSSSSLYLFESFNELMNDNMLQKITTEACKHLSKLNTR